MPRLRGLLWRLHTRAAARRARRRAIAEAAYEADLLAVCIAVGILPAPPTAEAYVEHGLAELTDYVKEHTT